MSIFLNLTVDLIALFIYNNDNTSLSAELKLLVEKIPVLLRHTSIFGRDNITGLLTANAAREKLTSHCIIVFSN